MIIPYTPSDDMASRYKTPTLISSVVKTVETSSVVTNQIPVELVPLHVHTYGDNRIVYHYSKSDYTQYVSNSLYNFTQIKHKKRLSEDISNEIITLEKQDEFLYYIETIYPQCLDTICYLYYNKLDGNINTHIYDIQPLNNIFEPIFNIDNKKSIYFSQSTSDGFTYFSNKVNYTNDQLQLYVGFIQKNKWIIRNTDYSISNNKMLITIPSDFILLLTW
jgi:hypothetical protein